MHLRFLRVQEIQLPIQVPSLATHTYDNMIITYDTKFNTRLLNIAGQAPYSLWLSEFQFLLLLWLLKTDVI
jgi:hypothetical protein